MSCVSSVYVRTSSTQQGFIQRGVALGTPPPLPPLPHTCHPPHTYFSVCLQYYIHISVYASNTTYKVRKERFKKIQKYVGMTMPKVFKQGVLRTYFSVCLQYYIHISVYASDTMYIFQYMPPILHTYLSVCLRYYVHISVYASDTTYIFQCMPPILRTYLSVCLRYYVHISVYASPVPSS